MESETSRAFASPCLSSDALVYRAAFWHSPRGQCHKHVNDEAESQQRMKCVICIMESLMHPGLMAARMSNSADIRLPKGGNLGAYYCRARTSPSCTLKSRCLAATSSCLYNKSVPCTLPNGRGPGALKTQACSTEFACEVCSCEGVHSVPVKSAHLQSWPPDLVSGGCSRRIRTSKELALDSGELLPAWLAAELEHSGTASPRRADQTIWYL